jgi:hypothetical protein
LKEDKISLASAPDKGFSRRMFKSSTWCGIIAAGLLAITGTAQAESPKSYQVTGPVLELSDSMIVVQKGKERWEIARDAKTKMQGDVQVGSKVTVMYTMTATEVETKAGKAAKKP